MENIDSILEKHGYNPSAIIQILTDIQKIYNYLPEEILIYLSQVIKVPLSKIYSIATFYSVFSLEPRGKHTITICMGTACFVRGAENVLKRIEDRLEIKAGSTSEDKLFTLETVNCLGACALAPIVVVDGKYHPKTTVQKCDAILDKFEYEKTAVS